MRTAPCLKGGITVFPAWHIALTALVTAAITMGGTAGWPLRNAGRRRLAPGDLVGVGLAAGLGVLLWRLGANIPTFNDDPLPGVSPADVLSTPMAYVAAAVYVGLRGVADGASGNAVSAAPTRLAIAPAVAALAALIVNIITI
jgi:hypothetical protein